MIPLQIQFRIIVLSFLFGFFGMFLYSVFNRMFFYKKNKPIRFIFEPIFFTSLTLFYFYLNYKVSLGYQTIYIPLFIVVGILIYQLFYATLFLRVVERFALFIQNKIIKRIKLDLNKKYVIIKKKMEKGVNKYAKKRIRKKKLLESKQGQQHNYDWSFFDCTDDRS